MALNIKRIIFVYHMQKVNDSVEREKNEFEKQTNKPEYGVREEEGWIRSAILAPYKSLREV